MYNYKWYHYIMILILLIIQPFISEWLMIAGVKPDFLLFYIILSAINKEKKQTLIVLAVTGFMYDLLYSTFFSQYIIVLLVAILTVWMINKIAQIEHVPYITIYGMIIGFSISMLKVVLALPISQITENVSYFIKISLISGLYCGSVFLLISLVCFLRSLFAVNTVQAVRRGH